MKMQDNIIDKEVQKGSSISDTWKAAYLLVFNEYIKMLDEMPSATCGSDANDILNAYGKGYFKGREDALSEVQLMKDYCDNDCNTTKEAAIAITKYLYKHETRKE